MKHQSAAEAEAQVEFEPCREGMPLAKLLIPMGPFLRSVQQYQVINNNYYLLNKYKILKNTSGKGL